MRQVTQAELIILIRSEIDKLGISKFSRFDANEIDKHCNNILYYLLEIDNIEKGV